MTKLSRKTAVSLVAAAFMATATFAFAGSGSGKDCKVMTKNCSRKGSKAKATAAKNSKRSPAGKVSAKPLTKSDMRGSASMRVVVDKETGELRAPNAEELKSMAAQSRVDSLNESDEGLEVVVHKNGMKSVDLQGRFMSHSVAKLTPDGTLVTACVSTEKEKKEFLEKKEAPKSELPVE